MSNNIHYINLLIMAKVIFADHLFARFLAKRDKYMLRVILSSFFCLLFAFFFYVPDSEGILVVTYGSFMYISLFICSGIGLFFCYKEDKWAIFFCTIVGYTIGQLASAFNEVLYYICMHYKSDIHENAVFFFSLAVTYISAYFIFVPQIRKYKEISIDNKRLLLLSTSVLFIDIIMGLVVRILSLESPRYDYLMLLHLYNALSCVFILCIQFTLLSNRHMEIEMQVMSKMLEEEKKQFLMSKDNIELINLKCHDLKYQIRKIRKKEGLIGKNELKEIENAIGIYDAVARTGNSALDIILTEKSLICEKSEIRFTCMADGKKMNFMADSDIYSLFGNAIDNAIEAVVRLTNKEQRNIGLTVVAERNMLSIHAENYFDGQLFIEGNQIKTKKENKLIHGFGLKSMSMITEKYGGYLSVSTSENVFYVNIVIPIPSENI